MKGSVLTEGGVYRGDGIRVIAENGRKRIGRTTEVTVTSVLQTTAGEVIFARGREDHEKDDARTGE